MKSRVAASVLLWLAAVASVARIAWIAIDTAGRQVTTALTAGPAPGLDSTGEATADSASPTRHPVTARPTTGDRSVDRTSATTKPTTAPTSSGPSTGPTVMPLSSTYSTFAGRIRVLCQGARLSLTGGFVQPAQGWAVWVQSVGPQGLRAFFRRSGSPGVVVTAPCDGGRPRFEQQVARGAPPSNGTGWNGWPGPSGPPGANVGLPADGAA